MRVRACGPWPSWPPCTRRSTSLEALSRLVARGLAWHDPQRGVGLTTDQALSDACVALVVQYRTNPLLILNPLTERALARVRTAAVRTFADAFVVRFTPRTEGEE
jgi:hypothetical protein